MVCLSFMVMNSNDGSTDINDRLNSLEGIIKFAVLNRCRDAIDTMLNDSTIVNNIEIKEINIDDIYTNFDYSKNVFAVYIKGIGDITLTLLLIIDVNDMKKLAEILIGNIDSDNLEELAASAVAEFGNILLAGAFTNALTNITDFRIDCTAPGYANDTLASIMEYIVADSSVYDFIYVKSELSFKKNKEMILAISMLIPVDDTKRLVEIAFRK